MKKVMVLTAAAMLLLVSAPGLIRYSGPAAPLRTRPGQAGNGPTRSPGFRYNVLHY